MDEELKRYLDNIMAAMQQMEIRIIAAVHQPREQTLDAVARKLEGLDEETDPDASRIEAGH
jgi:hypothetical protein